MEDNHPNKAVDKLKACEQQFAGHFKRMTESTSFEEFESGTVLCHNDLKKLNQII